MTNSVLSETIREFASDMIEQYDRLAGEGKSPREIVDIAGAFFDGLIDGTIVILKNIDQRAAIRGFACIIYDMIGNMSAAAKQPEEILQCVCYYLIGTVDGIDLSAGNQVSGNRHK